MRLASLFSGGKDSTYATYLASRNFEVKYLVTMKPARDDSWMFHTVNIHLAAMVAEALGIPSIIVDTSGDKEVELDDLKKALSNIEVEGVVSGAIASNYQKSRIDEICIELGFEHVAPLWGRSSLELLREMVLRGIVMIVTAVAAHGINQSWLGRVLNPQSLEDLNELKTRYGIDVCGEGGEMETLVLDAPWFKSRLDIIKAKILWDGFRGTYLIEKARLIPKDETYK